MRIWIFNHYATHPGFPGGSRHFHLSKYLVQKGHEVTIFASSFHYNLYKETQEYNANQFWKEQIVEGVRFIWFKTFPYTKNNWKRYLNILDYTNRIRTFNYDAFQKPDIILGSSFHLLTPYISAKIAKRFQVPFVSEIRDLWPETLRALGKSDYHPIVLILSCIEKYVYKNSNRIIVLFPKAHEYILSLTIGVTIERIIRIPNGVDCNHITGEFISLPQNKTLDFLSRKDQKLKVLNAGSFGNVYNLEFLLHAMKLLQDKQAPIHLYMVGNGVKAKALKELAKKLALENVSFHHSVGRSSLPALYANADVLYASVMDSPLYRWGMSLNKLHEYLAASKPIVFGYNQEQNPVNEARCGYTIPSNQPEAIANALLDLANMNKEERDVLGKRGRKLALSQYDFKILGKNLEGVLLTEIETNKNQ